MYPQYTTVSIRINLSKLLCDIMKLISKMKTLHFLTKNYANMIIKNTTTTQVPEVLETNIGQIYYYDIIETKTSNDIFIAFSLTIVLRFKLYL